MRTIKYYEDDKRMKNQGNHLYRVFFHSSSQFNYNYYGHLVLKLLLAERYDFFPFFRVFPKLCKLWKILGINRKTRYTQYGKLENYYILIRELGSFILINELS